MTDAVRLSHMDENSLVDLLEELAEGFGVKIRHALLRATELSLSRFGPTCQNLRPLLPGHLIEGLCKFAVFLDGGR